MKTNDGCSKTEVNLSFKLLSAIGIILVVCGHCYHGGISLGSDWFPEYSFHVPMLVFVSGYFYRENSEQHIFSYLKKRFIRLVLPAYAWNLLYGGLLAVLREFGYTFYSQVNVYNMLLSPFFDGEAFGFNLGSWFVYPLFAVCAVNVLFRKLLRLLKLNNEFFIAAVYFAVGMIGIWLAGESLPAGGKDGLRLLFRSMFFIAFFGLGRLYYSKLEKYDNVPSSLYFAFLLLIQLLLLTCFKNLEYTPSKMTGFQDCFLPIATSVTGTAFWLRVSKVVAPSISRHSAAFRVGDYSYSIMIHHFFGFFVVKWVFYIISELTPLFPDFNVAKLRSEFWYYYLPNGKTQWGLVYVCAGICLSIAVGAAGEWLGKIIKNSIKKVRDGH